MAGGSPFSGKDQALRTVYLLVLQEQEELKIAVTGYRGFIAPHLIRALKNEELSLIEQEDYPLGEKLSGAEAVVHLGAIAGARADTPAYQYFDLNVKRTIDLLEASRKAKTKKFIFISTCTVSQGVKNIYDISKQHAEKWCELYRQYIPDVTILRLYNVYGEGDSKSVIAKFVTAVENGLPVTIHGTGKQARDFIHVNDVVRAIMKALNSNAPLNKAVEVGTGEETTIAELASMIFRIMKKKVPVKFGPLPYDQLESAKSPKPLFVENPIPLEEGLTLMLKRRLTDQAC